MQVFKKCIDAGLLQPNSLDCAVNTENPICFEHTSQICIRKMKNSEIP